VPAKTPGAFGTVSGCKTEWNIYGNAGWAIGSTSAKWNEIHKGGNEKQFRTDESHQETATAG
jgi:hypothetical protein